MPEKKAIREVVEEEEVKETASYSRSTSSSTSSSSSSSDEREYEVQDLRDRLKSSRGSRFDLIENELGLNWTLKKFSRQSFIDGIRGISKDFIIHPDNRFLSLSLFFENNLLIKLFSQNSHLLSYRIYFTNRVSIFF